MGRLSILTCFCLFLTQSALGKINFGEALQKSVYFYEAQQSGKLPQWNRVPWRGDSTLDDGIDKNLDLTGGWFDAGDHVKFGFPMAATATILAWGVIEYPEAYERSGQMNHILNNLRFVADYFVRAHPEPNLFYGQIGKGSDDHSWWGPAEVLHVTTRAASKRPSYAITPDCPGSDLAGETSAALSAISIVFKDIDPEYSKTLLIHARELHEFANRHQGKYSDCITDAQAFYNSWSGYLDELVWSSAWLYRATNEQKYLDMAESLYTELPREGQTPYPPYKWTMSWDDKSYGTYVLMTILTEHETYRVDAERWLDFLSTGWNEERATYTPGGLVFIDQWGPNRYAANSAFMALVYADTLKSMGQEKEKSQTYYKFAVDQMKYIMGENPNGITYQVGMGEKSPLSPHHRTAHGSCTDSIQKPEINRHLIVGALVGGPDRQDNYEDDRSDYISNEVATDYNAGFTGALARLYLDFGGDPIPEKSFPTKEARDLELYLKTKINSTGSRYIEFSTHVYNCSAWPARVSNNLKFRYWVDLTDEFASGYNLEDFKVTTAYSQGSSHTQLTPWDEEKNLYYVEISFAGVDVFPGGQSDYRKEAQFRISLPTNSNEPEWKNEGDPSWDNYGNEHTLSPKMALYDGDNLVWGQQP